MTPNAKETSAQRQHHLGRATLSVAGGTLASRLLGFIRDVVLARVFGASAQMDVFIIAFQIPNFFRRLFAEGGFSPAFVPVISEYRAQRSETDLQELVRAVMGTLGMILGVFTVVGMVAAPAFVWVFSSGFDDSAGRFTLAVDALRITFPYLFFISLAACAGGVLNSYGRFFSVAIAPVLLNLCLIAAALFFAQHFVQPVMALAWAVSVSGALQWLLQLPFLKQLKLLQWPRWAWSDPGVQRVWQLMIPALFAVSATQINLIVDRHIASYLPTGSISWLYYGDRLLEFPLGILTVAIATAILPTLSRHYARQDSIAFARTLDWALMMVCFIGVPAAVALIMLAEPIVATLFLRGAFSAEDVQMTTVVLRAYGIGLIGLSLVKILAPGFFARQDTKTPVRAAIAGVVSNIALNVVLVPLFLFSDIAPPHVALALATSLAAFVNAAWLWRGLQRLQALVEWSVWRARLVKIVLSNGAMLVVLGLWMMKYTTWAQMAELERVVALLLVSSTAMVIYFAVLTMCGERWWHWWRMKD